ncbi:hypothetical protein B0H66DRAFT_585215 [Apodospora peruviana]|uniref:Uncharacterized protein n=1 Tax=Apodospora peruviana TaxID=516989 RepID=A0AAE0LY52_9PEZI|nr:hypothetical protein B0H66DRAFT_585215 [Apodospora peruviana]
MEAITWRVSATPVLSPRQYWPDPTKEPIPTDAKCIEESFSNPRWGIYDPALITVNGSSGGSMGDIRFLTMNAATGVVANCTANNIELDPKGADALAVWHNCSIPNLFFQFGLTDFELRLKGTWSCGNSSDALEFAAHGVWEQPLIQGCLDDWQAPRGEEILCIMGNSQVWGALTSPIDISPQLPILPYTPAEQPERCVDRSVDPAWQVQDVLYQHHFSQTKNETENHYHLSLNLTNISNNEKVLCAATIDQLENVKIDGSISWVNCVPTSSTPTNITSTAVMLDTINGVLGIKQSWNCTDGIEGVEQNDFTGTGYLKTDLECGKTLNSSIYNPQGYIVGAQSEYNCTQLSTNFSGYSPDPPVMPHTSYSRSCTIGSIVNTTSLILREYQIDTATDGTHKLGTFSLYNPGPEDTYRLTKIPVQDDGAWHDCVAGSRPLPWQLVKCQYLLDREKHHASFQIQWYCDDRDPSHAYVPAGIYQSSRPDLSDTDHENRILFSGTASTTVLPAEKCDAVNVPSTGWNSSTSGAPQGKSCRLPVTVTEVSMPVTTLTWKTSSGPMDRGPTLPWI